MSNKMQLQGYEKICCSQFHHLCWRGLYEWSLITHTQLLLSTMTKQHFNSPVWFIPCMSCALCMDSQLEPARKHAGNWRQSCLEQMVWRLPGRLLQLYHYLCAFSVGAEEEEEQRFITHNPLWVNLFQFLTPLYTVAIFTSSDKVPDKLRKMDLTNFWNCFSN